jgi:hypothetical protein
MWFEGRTIVTEPLTACNDNESSVETMRGMTPKAAKVSSVDSPKCEMICKELKGPVENVIIFIVVDIRPSFRSQGCTKHISTSLIGRPGTTAASMSGDADIRVRLGSACGLILVPTTYFPQNRAIRSSGCSRTHFVNGSSQCSADVSLVKRNGHPRRMSEYGPSRRMASSVRRVMPCNARDNNVKNEGSRSQSSSRSPISYERVLLARDGRDTRVLRQRTVFLALVDPIFL